MPETVEQPDQSSELEVFDVEIRRTSYGSVKVRARSKEDALRITKQANRRSLMQWFNEKYAFLNFGNVTEYDRNSGL